MSEFNDIGISRQLHWPCIRKLLTIGLIASALHGVGDMILGWGVEDETLTGMMRMLSAFTSTSDGGLFAAAMLGMFGMILEGLSAFGIYRLMAEKAPDYAHRYRSGIFGYVIFGACGFHVPYCAIAFLMKHGVDVALLLRCYTYFVLPSLALFWIFFLLMQITQMKAFAKGLTPYSKGSWVFAMPVGMLAAAAMNVFGNQPWVNAVNCAMFGIGGVWMFGGLLMGAKKAQAASEK